MDEVKKKYNSIDWVSLRRSAGKLKARAASNLKDMVMTDIENSVRAATSDTSWGATGAEMENIARATFHREEYPLVMGIVWERLSSKRWRNVYKSLELLKHLCLHGSQRCYDEAKEALGAIQALQSFRYVDSAGKDEGRNVRERAKALVELLKDSELMAEEREKSKSLRAKIGGGSGGVVAVSSDDYRYGTGPSQQTGYDYDNPYAEGTSGSGGGYGNYENEGGFEYGQDNYGYDVGGASQPAETNVTAGLDDLLGLGSSEVPAALPAPQSSGAGFGGDDDLFNPRALPPSTNTGASQPGGDAFGGFGADMFAALPPAAPSASAGTGATANPADDLFGIGSTTAPAAPSAPTAPAAGSGLDLFGTTIPTAAPSGGASVPAATGAPKSNGGDIFGDLVNFDSLGQVSRQDKKDVHAGMSLNAMAAAGPTTGAPSTGSGGTSDKKKNEHDILFGL